MNKKVKSFKDIKKLLANGDHNKPNEFGLEGEDHINISLHSKSNLGKYLDPGYASFFEYPQLGKFRTALNLIYWLRDPSHNDVLRTCKRKTINTLIGKHDFKPLDNHKAILLLAKYIQVLKNERIIREIKSLSKDTKVLSYRIHPDSGLRITTGYALIVIPVINELINAIQEDREPNFQRFLNINSTIDVGFIPHTVKFGIAKDNEQTEDVDKPKRRRRRKRKTGSKTTLNTVGTVVDTPEGFIIEGDKERVTISPDGISTERKGTEELDKGIDLATSSESS